MAVELHMLEVFLVGTFAQVQQQQFRYKMAFLDIFKDENDVNEKNVIGFISFTVMVVFAIVDLVTGYFGRDLVIQEFIYNSFVIVTLGSFGIASLEKGIVKREAK